MVKSVWMFALTVFLLMATPVSHAQEFSITDYSFVWNVADAGKVSLKIRKDPEGLQVVLSSLGGRLATLHLTPSEAKAVGQILAKTEEYHAGHEKYYAQKKGTLVYENERSEKVDARNHQVTFHSSPKGKEFEVKVSERKTFSPTVLMSKEQALKMSHHLLKSPGMAEFVNARVKP